jgi:hypothetical protein
VRPKQAAQAKVGRAPALSIQPLTILSRGGLPLIAYHQHFSPHPTPLHPTPPPGHLFKALSFVIGSPSSQCCFCLRDRGSGESRHCQQQRRCWKKNMVKTSAVGCALDFLRIHHGSQGYENVHTSSQGSIQHSALSLAVLWTVPQACFPGVPPTRVQIGAVCMELRECCLSTEVQHGSLRVLDAGL